jgi:hypothetical protein
MFSWVGFIIFLVIMEIISILAISLFIPSNQTATFLTAFYF